MTESQTSVATVIDAEPKGYVEYEIDIEKVLRAELPGVLNLIAPAPLVMDAILSIPRGAKGAYVLYENGHPVYAGKTDTRHGFRDRLNRHASTIRHRRDLDPTTISFKAIRILVFSNFDVEAILINALRKADPTALRWNDTGFGSNDPGHNRETQEPAGFDKDRPIDIDRPLHFLKTGGRDVLSTLIALKDQLPYVFRYQTDARPGGGRPMRYSVGHEDHRAALDIPVGQGETTRTILAKILAALPEGWRATIFPDRVILYKESTRYPHELEFMVR